MKVDLKQVHCILHINLYIRNFWPETKRQEKKKTKPARTKRLQARSLSITD